MSLPAKFPRTPILCYVTDRKTLTAKAAGDSRRDLLERISAAASAGLDWIQIREKDLSGKEISLLVRESCALAKPKQQSSHTTRILVNDRLDVALADRAAGVHLGENAVPVRDVSRWVGIPSNRSQLQDFLVGVSCHSLTSALEAERNGADYIFWGPVFTTPSKTAFGAPARSGSPEGGLQCSGAAGASHRRHHARKCILVPRSRSRRHRRHPPFSGRRRFAGSPPAMARCV